MRSLRLLFGVAGAIVLAAAVLGCSGREARRARGGVLDLTGVSLADEVVALDGDWELTWGALVPPSELPGELSRDLIAVPRTWRDQPHQGRPLPAAGAATYRLRVRGLPPGMRLALRAQAGVTLRLFVDGKPVLSVGEPSVTPEQARSEAGVGVGSFVPTGDSADVVLHVANHEDARGGAWTSISLGGERALLEEHQRRTALDAVLFGTVLVIGLYHLAIYVARPRDRSGLWFGLFCCILALRTLVTGEFLFRHFWPGGGFAFAATVAYASFLVAVPLFMAYLHTLFPEDAPRFVERGTWITGGALALFVLVTPTRVFTEWLGVFQLYLVSGLVYGVALLVLAVRRRRPSAGLILGSFCLLALCAANDMAASYGVFLSFTTSLTPIGTCAFVFVQALLLARRYATAHVTAERATAVLSQTSAANARFVPARMLDILGKPDVVDVRLGDHVTRDMSILFLDIRGFTTLLEGMDSEDAFALLNSFLSRMSPHIRACNGYIDKFIGDAFMALFPDSPRDALTCAVRMSEALRDYNDGRRKAGYAELRIGIGVHHGKVILGTIGEAERMEGTVISDAVNTAFRIEGMTKVHGVQVLVSRACVTAAGVEGGDGTYRLRSLGPVQLPGKHQAIEVLELSLGE